MGRVAPSPPQSLRDSSPIKGERRQLVALAKGLRRNMTVHECLLWQDLKRLPEFRFRRQAIIGQYIVDFACHKTKCIIELDGSQHTQRDQITLDNIRDQWLRVEGYTVLRFWNPDTANERDGVIDSLYAKLRLRSPLMGELGHEAGLRGLM